MGFLGERGGSSGGTGPNRGTVVTVKMSKHRALVRGAGWVGQSQEGRALMNSLIQVWKGGFRGRLETITRQVPAKEEKRKESDTWGKYFQAEAGKGPRGLS